MDRYQDSRKAIFGAIDWLVRQAIDFMPDVEFSVETRNPPITQATQPMRDMMFFRSRSQMTPASDFAAPIWLWEYPGCLLDFA
ncbi:MAG: hypothetical protein N838_16130 [Thiohalocapsa sp. PB-PSB1]|jgi:hypothetical protein|nr:MAG: hypothetical protein N838_16130 [Thiohalocapsa sp. PB-PSB1]HCS90677.1 hypothetical protein [Chromatiaceae bacterium]